MPLDPFVAGALVYSSLLSLMSLGLTMTYLTTKVPNFAHGMFVSAGTYTMFTLVMIHGFNPYLTLPFAFAVGGLLALFQYVAVLKPMIARGSPIVMQMAATLAFSIVMIGILNAYADYLTRTFKIQARDISLEWLDPTLGGIKAVTVVAPAAAAALVLALHLFLTKTKWGVAMRAAIENRSLAEVLGVNTNAVYMASWFIAGGLAGVSGALLGLRFNFNPMVGWTYLASIFAASIVGGLSSIYGAVLGGYLIGLVEVLGTMYLALILAPGSPSVIIQYRPLIPLIAAAATLLIAPQGLAPLLSRRR
jgi:branched-chain amino acid transport system permease protein